jgi:peptidoglycan/xylan/chitin deacetylase (PgdA/CDA1 family)
MLARIKNLLLGPYYYGTLPYRWWHSRQAAAAGRVPVVVVFYHRVADDAANAWTISRARFKHQIDWLARHFELISLQEVQARVRGRSTRPCVSITFDDGYSINSEFALPLLLARGIPCTYFVTVGNVLEGEPFPHDAAHGHHFAPNTIEELRHWRSRGVEIGVHGRTHCNLGAIRDPLALWDEIVAARRDLEVALAGPVRYFAFPFGLHAQLSAAAFHLAREAGYEAVCSAYGGYNEPGGDPFHIQRFGAEGPLLRLKNWATVDPLKRRRVKPFVPLPGEPTLCPERTMAP